MTIRFLITPAPVRRSGFFICHLIGGDGRLFPKTGFDVSGRYTLVADALRRLKVRSVVLDGEVCCNTFDDLWSRKRDHAAHLFAFDLLELDGADYRESPLIERKARLEAQLPSLQRGNGVAAGCDRDAVL